MRRRRSRGASSTEYALLIALLGSVICLGIGAFAKDLFTNSLCTIGQFLGAGNCLQAEPSPGLSTDGQDDGQDGGGSPPSTSGPLPTGCQDPPATAATPTPTPTSPSPTASPGCPTT